MEGADAPWAAIRRGGKNVGDNGKNLDHKGTSGISRLLGAAKLQFALGAEWTITNATPLQRGMADNGGPIIEVQELSLWWGSPLKLKAIFLPW